MIRQLVPCLLMVSFLPQAQGEDYSDNPDVIKALTRYHVSHEFARKRLVRDLETAQNNAMQAKQLDQAITIQTYREKIKAGATIPRDYPELRMGLDGLRYQWGRDFDRRFGIYLNFTAAQLHWEEPGRENRSAYRAVSSREILRGPNRILFSPDLKRLIYLEPNFELRTGICLNPKANLPRIPKPPEDESAFREGMTPGEEWSGRGVRSGSLDPGRHASGSCRGLEQRGKLEPVSIPVKPVSKRSA